MHIDFTKVIEQQLSSETLSECLTILYHYISIIYHLKLEGSKTDLKILHYLKTLNDFSNFKMERVGSADSADSKVVNGVENTQDKD